MSSWPSQQPAIRRAQSEQAPASHAEDNVPKASTPSSSSSSFSSESESILLNAGTGPAQAHDLPSTSQPIPKAQAAPPPPNLDLRTCWICQMDESEDAPDSSTWRTPCPCSLTAHDDCLLEWIASEEAPRPGDIARNHKIVCPQCKAELKIERSRDYLVAVVERLQWLARSMIFPAGLSAVAGCFYSGLLVHGYNSMQMVFGVEEARVILAQGTITPYNQKWIEAVRSWMRVSLTAFDPFFPDIGQNVKIFLGLPLIAPSLVMLRTKLGDRAFALLLPLYMISDPVPRNSLHWPPSPALAFATVPYLRTMYNEIYRHTFSSLEKEWDLAVQRKPRDGETAEQVAAARREEGEPPMFELELVLEEAAEEEEELPPRLQRELDNRRIEREQNAANAAALVGENILADPAAAPINQERAQAAPPAVNDDNPLQFRQGISTTQIASTVIGALFFPFVSSIMGDLLKYTLPTKWVGRSLVLNRSNGLLKEKWGRSLVGGCLFVVLKDVVTLYCKWRKAKDFGKSKVLDYTGRRRKT